MNKMELLLHGWDSCYDREDWYPPLKDALNGLTWEQAAWKPRTARVNTIWETVQHLIFYKMRLYLRLTGEESEYPEGISNDDTFGVPVQDEAAWQEALQRLDTVHQAIRALLEDMDKKDFERRIPTTPIGLWVNSLILHDAYHTGQIIQLRKMQKSWPAKRSFE
ncbi:DinB family protein [Cohnella fermenti]|uniref:DinB family protein n=1 Tax=Cohnella fermenti TaxID=2565925 RepID=A0A4S4C0N6_9BACL|nr:DinB family protein [Cohnella fermenti]THF81183.1 DinB family protein [Cohnella fermenti]